LFPARPVRRGYSPIHPYILKNRKNTCLTRGIFPGSFKKLPISYNINFLILRFHYTL
jgi:hypothetical protein